MADRQFLSQVRDDFTEPSSSHRMRAWLAMLGLLLFIAIYVGIAGWFTYVTWRMAKGVVSGGEGAFFSFLVAVASGFLAIFMWKAFFFLHRGEEDPGIEITASDQPKFFAFLYELADEIGAPRPHRVFVAPGVNACVFYDLSVLNFLLASKKNLLIGLGLVNVTTRSEFRAVLAHEFGHFAQKTMAVGRWVYMGEQVAGHMIAHRGKLDAALDFISAFDLRVAWIGWIMRTIVWSIRSLMETLFRVVIIAHRALSREMEFNADLVAVSVTGSDALVHGLYRLQPADEDWNQSLHFCSRQFGLERRVTDIFAVHEKVGEHMQRILGPTAHRDPPPIPDSNPATHRIFSAKLAAPPKMWLTHPPNTEREANAKREYVRMPLDDSRAWTVFENVAKLRESVTRYIFEKAEFENEPSDLTSDELNKLLDEEYSSQSWDPKYHGVYLGRWVTRNVDSADDLLPAEQIPREEIADTLKALYPQSLAEDMAALRNHDEEIALLEAVESGRYEAAGGMVEHRGEAVRPGKVAKLIESVKAERAEVLDRIDENDRLSRAAHHAAARYVAYGWQDYLSSLLKLLHYVEHSEADLNDAYDQLTNTTQYAAAAGAISGRRLKKVMKAASDLHGVLSKLNSQAESIQLPTNVRIGLKSKSWRETVEVYELPSPSQHNIADWMRVIDGWAGSMSGRFGRLRDLVLDELLLTESRVRQMYFEERERVQADKPFRVAESYTTRVIGTERKRQTKLDWWSRFKVADGMVPTILRLSVASAIVGSVMYFGAAVGKAKVVIYNGLNTPVVVTIGERQAQLYPRSHEELSLGGNSEYVTTRTLDGRLIEEFEAPTDRGFATYVYNVARSAPLVEWTATYGSAAEKAPRHLGCERWRTTAAGYVFRKPPRQMETSGSGTTVSVLDAYGDLLPQQMLSVIEDEQQQADAILAHCKWDDAGSRNFAIWAALLTDRAKFGEILSNRLQQSPDDVVLLRMEQDSAATEDTKAAVKKRHRELAAKHPDDPDWKYIGTRAMDESPERDRQFVDGFRKWPNHYWFAFGAGHVHMTNGRWQETLDAYGRVVHERRAQGEYAAMRIARIRRLLDGRDADLKDIRSFYEVDVTLQIEEGLADIPGYPCESYHQLEQGNLQAAYDDAMETLGEVEPRLLVLLAASDSAKPEWQEMALALKADDIIDEHAAIFVASLALRQGKPYQEYLDRFEELLTDRYDMASAVPMPFLRELIEAGPDVSLEERLIGIDAENRGLAYAAAVVMFPDRVPKSWRQKARRLLFSMERPYFEVK